MSEIIVFRSYFVIFSFSVMLLIFKFFFSFLSSFFLPLFFSWDQWKSHRVVIKSMAYESSSSILVFSTLWTCDLGQVASLLGVSFFSSVNGDNSIILSPRTIVLMSAWHLVSTQYILISSLYLRLLQKAESQVTYEASCILQVTYFIFCIPATNVCSIFSYSRSITLLFYY